MAKKNQTVANRCSNKPRFQILSILFILTAFFCSCSGVIFDDIREEVELEDAQISGDVNSIVRFGDYIFLQNGNIWKKKADSESAHGWTQVSKPSASADYTYVNRLAADSKYLYAQMTILNENSDDGEIQTKGSQLFYSEDGENWKGPIKFTNSDDKEIDTIDSGYGLLFCTNAVQKNNRKAYFHIQFGSSTYKWYELNGETPSSTTVTSDENSPENPTTTDYYAAHSCAYFNGNVYFWKNALATNETADAEATILYRANGSKVAWTTDGENWTEQDTSSGTIYSLSCTKNYLYLGTSKGIEHVEFNTTKSNDGKDVPDGTLNGKTTSDFGNNAKSTLSSYYEVRVVLAMKADAAESDSVIYGTTTFSGSPSSTSATQENVGLWSYIPSRGKWNRE